jgi:hypothetical protein
MSVNPVTKLDLGNMSINRRHPDAKRLSNDAWPSCTLETAIRVANVNAVQIIDSPRHRRPILLTVKQFLQVNRQVG